MDKTDALWSMPAKLSCFIGYISEFNMFSNWLNIILCVYLSQFVEIDLYLAFIGCL